MKRNIMMIVEYSGTNFFGWQKQTGKRTVQGELEEKISKMLNASCKVEGCGRTDRGVHAKNYVATVVIERNIPLTNFKNALNKLLSDDVVVKKMKEVPLDFHPRFSAKRKTYEYIVDVSKTRSAIKHNLVTHWTEQVDMERMVKAGQILVGEHNFKAFCSSHTNVTNFNRTIYEISVKKVGKFIKFEITGNGFLYNMVRIIVGTLLQIDKVKEENIVKALKSGDRSLLGKTMPPNGLYLKKVEYV